jgi:large subunit ribosomal protein L35Ae
MQGIIMSQRRGKRTQHISQFLVKINDEKYNSKTTVMPLLGKKVVYKTIGDKVITGKIIAAHGNKGIVRVGFEKGLPGTAISEKVDIK